MGNAFRKVILSGLLVAPFSFLLKPTAPKPQRAGGKGYGSNVSVVKPSSVSTLKLRDIQRFDNARLPWFLLNTGAGVRIENARRKLSYRPERQLLAVSFQCKKRKSLPQRHPHHDGNSITYFNQIDFNNIGSVEILKGLPGSIYGAGIGGVISLSTKDAAAGKN
ncbi:MAG: TonB-dependent receptor plug domain-containing protein [Cytophagaceae bacterium]|nr:TonB-dependent receptor plug domain-containing protein [Cytophagaceae bacterium]